MTKTIHCPACGAKTMTEVDRDTRKKYFHCSSCASKFSLVFNMDKIIEELEIQYSLGG